MFTDMPFLSVLADQRHRELLADAEQHRLGRLARAARRVRPPARSRAVPPASAPPSTPPTATPTTPPSTHREPARERRTPVPG